MGLAEPTAGDEHDLRLGFLAFVDRPKADAGTSIAELHRLDIDVKAITGDNGTVATKVCRDLGVPVEDVLAGEQIEQLGDDALLNAIPQTTIFAR